MIDWDDLKYLARLAEAGSLSGAARLLRVEHATVGRRIAALEAAVGTRLVDRRGGRYTLTDAGASALVEARRMEAAAVAVQRIGLAEAAAPVEFSVTAPPAIATDLIVPQLPAFLARNGDLRLRLIAQSRMLSLNRGEADIALRLSRPEGPTLTVRHMGRLIYGLFAAPGYAASRQDAEWRFVGLEEDMSDLQQQVWLERFAAGRPIVFRSDDLALQCAAVRAGMGIAALPLFLGEARGLARVSPEHEVSREIWLTYHEDLRKSPRLAAVTQFLADCLKGAVA